MRYIATGFIHFENLAQFGSIQAQETIFPMFDLGQFSICFKHIPNNTDSAEKSFVEKNNIFPG